MWCDVFSLGWRPPTADIESTGFFSCGSEIKRSLGGTVNKYFVRFFVCGADMLHGSGREWYDMMECL